MASSPLTLGESLAHLSRCEKWTMAVCVQIWILGSTSAVAYYAYTEIPDPALRSNPWLLALLISFIAYFSVLLMVRDYACLFLPRTPVAIDQRIGDIGMWGVGMLVIVGMVSAVLALGVRDSRVLAACTGVADACILGLVGFGVWLARTYGGGDGDGDGDALDVV